MRIQSQDFCSSAEQAALLATAPQAGAVVSFVGLVRGVSAGRTLHGMSLEHYPGMTEGCIESMMALALAHFDILNVRVVHRIGRLRPGEQIVGVWVAAEHRAVAFEGAEFLMDYLKIQAPFWKKEHRSDGDHWVQARLGDEHAAARWLLKPA